MLKFFEQLALCLIGMEACGTAHHWARELLALGHDVRLMPPTSSANWTSARWLVAAAPAPGRFSVTANWGSPEEPSCAGRTCPKNATCFGLEWMW